jgi:gas vesicle protein
MDDKSGFGYFLLGLGIGVAAGVLWAPRSGEETRQYLSDRAGEGAEYVRGQAEQGKQYLREQTDTLKGSASDLYDKGRTTVQRQKENLTAAVEAGKQAYREAVGDIKTTAAGATASANTEQ